MRFMGIPGLSISFFQGGTALRWVYGGSRFSEDLDFVTCLAPDKIQSILKAVTTKASVPVWLSSAQASLNSKSRATGQLL